MATQGYVSPQKPELFAFYPLWPMILSILDSLLGQYAQWIGVFLNIAFFSGAVVLLRRWVLRISPKLVLPFLLLLVFDRFSFWSHTLYSESVFFLLMAGLLSSTELKTNWKAQLLGGISTANRAVGGALIGGIGLANIAFYLKKPHKGIFALLLGASGLILFFVFNEIATGNAFANISAQSHWSRSLSFENFLNSLFHSIRVFIFPTSVYIWLVIYFVAKPPKSLKLRSEDRWMCLLLLAIPLFAGPIALPRFVSIIPLAYLAVAFLFSCIKNRKFQFTLFALWLLGELFWQWKLTQKFYLGHNFPWIG